ncbi:uncharacterized protein LOC133033115 [Cannabis sativa]|uniref:uncharacterized protein LOC133033115 n=1 Tax=Cannabis sativa TaxID=3483 RepID=UPI0029C9D78F|nr:uncharacterized protein LOC133033115 [Cannabis sativa]
MFQGLAGQKNNDLELDRARGSPFSLEINVLELPHKFKRPTWKMYTGKEDPFSHLKYFEMQMDLQGARGDVCCRVFPTTLLEATQQWYFKLALGRFNSWKALSSEFHAQFSSSRQLLLHLEDLVKVKRRPGEPLRAYISRFMTEATKVARVTEDGKLSEILGDIEVLRELWKDLRKNRPINSMSDFLDRADGFIKLEEAIHRAEVEQKPSQPKVPSVGTSVQLPQYPKSSNSSGKWSNNNNRQGNGKKGKFVGETEQAPRENTTKFTAFSVLTEDIKTVYMATQSLAPGIRKNNPHVQKYVKADQNQKGDNNKDLLPPPVDGHLQVIIRGPHIAGDSGKARERYARTVQHEQEEVVLAVEERKPKIPRAGEPTITFSDEDDVKISFPHNDPLVVEVQIANKMVARTMIDNGASTNILFKAPYENMGLQLKDLTPCLQTVYGFSGQNVTPLGRIRLPLTVGQAPRSITIMAQFLVLDVPSAFNVMLGRPALYDLKTVTSIFHSCLKFPTKNGVGCLRGNQQVAWEYYNLALTKAKKEVSSSQSSDKGKSISK